MDPLSVTLAAITLGTAVKDLVELGQKIHESFGKVSKNLRNAQHIAQNIMEMVEEIKDFCEEHKDTLHNMKGFCVALRGLQVKFRSFETSILPLLHKTEQRKLGPFIRGWWNNNKIEEHIASLQTDILIVMRRYMMASTMRIELKQGTNHQETIRALEGVRGDIRALHTMTAATRTRYSYESAHTTRDELTSNIIMFAQSTPSTSMPMLRSPDVITEEVATAVYIKVQINSIATIVEKILTIPILTQTSVENLSWTAIPEQRSMGIMHLRHHVVRDITGIRDLLESGHLQTVFVNDATIILLNNLSGYLSILDMHHESIVVGKWTVTLARTLFNAFGDREPELGTKLVFYLVNQSTSYYNTGDKTQSLKEIEEAYAIIQNLRSQYGGEDRFQILYSSVLLQYAALTDNKTAMAMSMEAIENLDGILNIQTFTQSTLPEEFELIAQPSSAFLNQLCFCTQKIPSITIYARALQELGAYLLIDGAHSKSALDLALLAVAVHRKLASLHGYAYRVELALALSSLVQGIIANIIPGEDFVNLADECIQILRELAEKNPPHYAWPLANVLCVKARALKKLNQGTEVIIAWEEVFSLASQIIQDSELCATALDNLSQQFRHVKKYDDAARTGTLAITKYQGSAETQAVRYLDLSLDHQDLRHYKESAQAARKSVTLYQDLAMGDPSKWTADLIFSLSNLAHSLAALGDSSGSQLASKESMTLMDNFLDTQIGADFSAISRLCATSTAYRKISLITEDKEESFNICSNSIRYLKQLLKIYPQYGNTIAQFLFWAEINYAYNMHCAGCSQDAQRFIDVWLNQWGSEPEANPEYTMASWCGGMIDLKISVFDVQGYTRQALLLTQYAQDIVTTSVSTSQPSLCEMIESMYHAARLQGKLGNSREALAIAEKALQLARDSTLEPIMHGLIWSLHAVASTALLHRDYDRAVEAAEEGCKMLNTPEGFKFDEDSEFDSFIRPSMYALLSSASVNLGRYMPAVEYARRAVEASLEIGENKLHISPATAEHSYIETGGNLAEIVLAIGAHSQARQICEERQAYFTERVEKRMGEYRELAPILRMLGILCCSEGRHEEGADAATELAHIIKALGSAFPSLQEEVKIRLRHQVQVPILKVLNDMNEKLDCGHQPEISSLFA